MPDPWVGRGNYSGQSAPGAKTISDLNTTAPSPPGAINFLRIAIVAIIWGGAFMAVSIAVAGLPPLSVAAARVVIGALALLALMRLRRAAHPDFRDAKLIVWLFIVALFSTAFPFALLSWGQQHVPSAFAGMTMACLPLFVLPLAHFFVPGDQVNLRKVTGFAIGLIGTMILIGTGGLSSAASGLEFWARAACVLAALCYAIGSIFTRLCPPIGQLALATYTLVFAATPLSFGAMMIDGIPANIGWDIIFVILYLGLFPTAIAFIIKVQVIRSAGPSFMVLTNYQVPVWSVIFGAIFLGESLPAQLFAALILILLGVAITQWPVLRGLIRR